jgi:hypothetical protein
VLFLRLLASVSDPRWVGEYPALPVLAVLVAVVAAVLLDRYIVVPVDRWRQARVTGPGTLPTLTLANVSTA